MIPENSKQVTVSTSSIQALGEPQFLIAHEGGLFLTMAVVSLNPSDPQLGEADSQTIESLLQQLDAQSGPTRAVSLTQELAEFVQIDR